MILSHKIYWIGGVLFRAAPERGPDMTQVDAIYQGGVFKPVGKVDLRDNQKVKLFIAPTDQADIRAWLAETQKLRQELLAEHGYFPDSAADIAADRMR
jgi:predicted DNA-binding antitoxin AbrB/MazE fold protein